MTAEWRVWALRAGRSQMDRSMATYMEGMGEPLAIPHTMFLLRGPRTVLVDTSFQSCEAVASSYPQEIWRNADEEPLVLLQRLGIRPDDVELIICTHLHYDHCGTNRSFAQARVLVQRTELEYALDPVADVMRREFFSPAGGFVPPYDQSKFDLIDGDVDLGDGLLLLHLPGHTPGSQGLLAETERGLVGLAGDQIMVQENLEESIPVGLHTDVDAWYRSLRKLTSRTRWVIPSHDLRVFEDDDPIRQIA